jgi:hypothetical protein
MDNSQQVGQAHCPVCGSTQIQAVQMKTGNGFDAVDGVCGGIIGTLCLGPIGLLFVLCGLREQKDVLARMCLNCGHRF